MGDIREFQLPGAGLKCNACGSVLPRVSKTITTDGFITRRRVCPSCGRLNITSERVIHTRETIKYFRREDV